MSTTTHNATASPKPDKHRQPPGGPDATRLYRKMQDLRSGVTTAIDPLGVATPIVHAQMAWLLHPQELGERMAQLLSDLWQLQWHTTHRLLGLDHPDPIQPNADDARFNDPIWSESPNWDMVKDWYLAFTHRAQDMLYDTPGLSSRIG
ncbi:MAG: alpha/beta hydrolase, partial [Zoogloea sp.]|nr:alpha/beta hydrolase [Zoogloea sp.]